MARRKVTIVLARIVIWRPLISVRCLKGISHWISEIPAIERAVTSLFILEWRLFLLEVKSKSLERRSHTLSVQRKLAQREKYFRPWPWRQGGRVVLNSDEGGVETRTQISIHPLQVRGVLSGGEGDAYVSGSWKLQLTDREADCECPLYNSLLENYGVTPDHYEDLGK